jgi:hypothetical protein
MNSFPKLIASLSALIASLSFAWLALTITGTIPDRHVTVYRRYSLQGPPQLLGKEGKDVCVILAVANYELLNDRVTPPARRSSVSRSIYRVKSSGSNFKIISAMEGKQE